MAKMTARQLIRKCKYLHQYSGNYQHPIGRYLVQKILPLATEKEVWLQKWIIKDEESSKDAKDIINASR